MFILSLNFVYATTLPTVGGDENNWGTILNNYLLVEHTGDGTHKNITLSDDISDIKTTTSAGDLHIQRSANSDGRVRLFRDTTGNPLFNIWGYDTQDLTQKPITIGIFQDNAFNEAGAKTRAIITSGGNELGTYNGLELQSPSQIRITAVDDVLNGGDANSKHGTIRLAVDKWIELHARTAAETDATKYIKFDTRGKVAGGDPTIETNAADGQLQIQPNANSDGRVRFFRDTTANPMINIWGYDTGNSVQKPLTLGVFNDPAFTEAGNGATARAIITSGGNGATDRNALEIQSPSQIRITAVDNILNAGNVRIAADTYTTIHSRTDAETDSSKYIKFDTVGGAQGADPTIETNSGDLVLNPAGDVNLKNGFNGECDLSTATTLTVVKGVITDCS